MKTNRRQWLKTVATGAAAVTFLDRSTQTAAADVPDTRPSGIQFGMCDWNLGRMDPSAMKLAKQIGLDGVQVSLGTADNNMWLRKPEVQQQYREALKDTGMNIASIALGELNNVPLMSEPRAAIWMLDALHVAEAMGVKIVMPAFFLKGELKEDNQTDMRRVTEVMQELAPRAEDMGLIIGLETYMSLEGHLKILEKVNSPALQVYYDFYNLNATKGYDFVRDLKELGRERICQVHFKEGPHYLGETGTPDWPKVADTLQSIGYRGWVVLETSAPSGNVVADTKKNLAYAESLFAS